MNNYNEINSFLRYYSKIYEENPNLPITSDTIYDGLKFYDFKSNNYRKNNISIVEERKHLEQQYRNNNLNTFYSPNNIFWVIENRNNLSDDEYYDKINKSIKLYIDIDEKNIDFVSKKIIDFIIENNIITQSKISKNLRNDTLVLRIEKYTDALKIINYVNELNYIPKYKTNPFLFRKGKVGIAKDGRLSYNSIISKMIAEYFKDKRITNRLNNTSYEDFKNYIETYNYKSNKNYAIFHLNDRHEYNDFIMITNILKSNLKNMTQLELFNNNQDTNNINNDIDLVRVLLDKLLKYYDIKEAYLIMENFINSNNINYFTRKDGIRDLVHNNYSTKKLEKDLEAYVWNLFLNTYNNTYIKYSLEQTHFALKELFVNNNYNAFTNDNNARTYLNKYVPIEYLIKVAYKKCIENGFNYSIESINTVLNNEINIESNINKKVV